MKFCQTRVRHLQIIDCKRFVRHKSLCGNERFGPSFPKRQLSIKPNKFYSNQPTILVTLVGTVVVSYPLNVGFCGLESSWHHRSKKKKKISTGREGAHLSVGMWVGHGVSQLNMTKMVAYQQNDHGRRLQKFARHFLADVFSFHSQEISLSLGCSRPTHRLNNGLEGGL